MVTGIFPSGVQRGGSVYGIEFCGSGRGYRRSARRPVLTVLQTAAIIGGLALQASRNSNMNSLACAVIEWQSPGL